ncbi:MAG: hypothetical protein FWE23_08890 [Chitinivibrionia bacterium]|nr:hypothetical protein [Chitinivibrionia bacterium]
MAAGTAAAATAITGALAAGTSATMSGVRGKRNRRQQQRQWQAEFDNANRQWEQQFAFGQQQHADNELQRAWERQWGDVLNNLQRQQGQLDVSEGEEGIRTNRIMHQMQRNDAQRQMSALQNMTLGMGEALANARGSRLRR